MQIREVFDRKRFVFLDGGMGTQLQARGLQPGQKPELAALEMPEVLTAIHTDYANAGADILLANTFGANAKKLTGCGHTVEEVVSASIACARKAAETTGACVALDIGPLGELLVPAGTLAFEDAYNEFAQVIRAGAAAGADLVFLETMTDLYELKAAILAARENCDLPVFTSMSFESRGRTFTGCTVESYAVTAAGLGADAVGINCSLGPKEILPFAQRLCRSVPAGVPVFVKPNAGLPNPDGSYNLDPDEFAAEMKEYAAIGVSMVGGCCGTTPAFIARLHETFSPLTPADKIPIRRSCLCTPVRFVEVDGITVVGEHINPTGKKRLQQALRDGDSAYPCTQAVAQAEAGAQVLDVNAGLPGIDEAATLEQLVKDLQAVTDLPLQLDSSNPEALSRALRIYNGSYRFDGDYNYDPDPNARDRARADWTGTEAQLTYTGIAQHKVVVGVDAQWNTRVEQQYYEVDSGDMILDTNDTSRTVGLYAQDEWRFHPQWLLNASLRYDKHSDFDAVTSPRAALIWQPTQRLTLKGIVGSSYRTPNAYERFYNDNGDSQNANPDLQPEEVAGVELAAAYRFGQSGRVGLSVYRNEITDLIDQVTDDAGVSTFINQDKVHARGVEVEAENRWAGGVSLRGSVAWQESEKDDGSELVDSPNWLGKVVLGVPIAFGWTASGEILGVAAREGDNGPVPGYGIVNLSVFSAPAARFGQFSLSIYNLGDKKYDDPTSNYMLHESIEQNGRQFRLRWTLPL